jgi:hypothetical protein
LLKDRLELGPLRRAFCRAHRPTAMTTISPNGVYAQPKPKTPPSRMR